ncbi:MAG: DUF4399 domain-containing protein [Burkholderiaceae bacterium]
MTRYALTPLWAAALMAVFGAATAAPLPADDTERSCWLNHTQERTRANLKELTAVDFSNLRNGYKVASPFQVDFAVRGMGVVPAGKELKGTGHHHILVDSRMPPSVTEKLPFNDKHRHFGKGQTTTLLDLPPGKHTLRLLFADHEHRPYFVFSPEITVEVLGPRSSVPRPKIDPTNFDASCAAWYQDEVSRPRPPDEPLHFTNVRAGESLVSPFNLRLGVDGFGVCARGQSAEKAGHFMLDVLTRAERKPVQSFDLSNGATQANLFIPVGSFLLRLRFVDPVSGADLLRPHELPVSVTQQDRI